MYKRQELDHAVFSLKITDHLVNGHGIVHGGYIFTLADTTFAYACNSRGLTTVAAGVDITFVQAAYLGDVLIADARVRANWGRSGITDVTVIRESDGALVAEFRGRSRQIPPKATPVSYTHLDVYKRQVLHMEVSPPCRTAIWPLMSGVFPIA